MIELAIYSTDGKQLESMSVDEALLGSDVRYALLKQAIVMYHANTRVGTAASKSRGMVAGTTKKLFRQKGTGNARAGSIRTCKRVGGGVAFAKVRRDFGKAMPKKQRRLARDSAVLAKLLNEKIVVVDKLAYDVPKTKDFAQMLNKLGIERSCLVATKEIDTNVYKSARNIPRIAVQSVEALNAGQVCGHEKMLFTKEALESFLDRSAN
ncbi:50S ribosomal protein L4 [Planctomycetota bacterium]